MSFKVLVTARVSVVPLREASPVYTVKVRPDIEYLAASRVGVKERVSV